MKFMTLFQDLVANLDVYLPWLLPSLEAIEQLVPSSGRLLICVPLMIWLAVLRQRSALAAAGRYHQVVH